MSNLEKEHAWKVCVRCLTFNHAPYIEDAMNGFCMQETDFPFVCTIIDDASTDGEQEVIKRYIEEHFDLDNKTILRNEETEDYVLTFARHKTNKNCYFAVLYLKYNHYSIKKTKMPYIAEWHENCKYIALCEGDDYWIDPLKLQKQVEILENNPKVMMVYTGFQTVDACANNIVRPVYEGFMEKSKDGDVFCLLLKGNFIMTLTTCFRSCLFREEEFLRNMVGIDYYYFLYSALKGDVRFISERTGCYRKSPDGMMETSRDKANKLLRIAFVEISRKYFNGYGKTFSFKEHFSIRLQIAQKAWRYVNSGEKDLIKNICLYDKKMYFYLTLALFVIIFRKCLRLNSIPS